MERGIRRRLVIGATGLAVLAGAGVAYGVTQGGSNEREAFLNDAAKRLNVTPQKLKDALKGAFEDRLDAAVKAGRLTQEEADRIKKKIEQGAPVPPIGGPPRHFFRHGPGGPIGPFGTGVDAAAKYLGLTDKQLFDKLRNGKSLADIAGDQGKSVDGLKNAIRDSVKSKLDAMVKDKRITQDQENRILNGFDDHIDDLVNGKPPRLRFHHRGPFKAGRGFHFGAAPAGVPAPSAGPII